MLRELTMPKVGHLMEEGTIVKWRKQIGDKVEKGDIVYEIEMDKAVVEVESFESGVLLKVVANEGDIVPVGEPVAILGDPGDVV